MTFVIVLSKAVLKKIIKFTNSETAKSNHCYMLKVKRNIFEDFKNLATFGIFHI